MRYSSLLGLTAELAQVLQLWPILIHTIPRTQGVTFAPAPNLDLSSMGRVALTGNFDSISLYTNQQQTENVVSTNGTQSLITQLPNGDFTTIANADGYIKTMCPFVLEDGTFDGVIVGGNFTSLGGVQAQGIAMYGPASGKITPLPGLTGQVNAILCDQASNTVYVGGAFKGVNSTNAVAWVAVSGWANLPFEGFNGPVKSVTMGSNGKVIFGGSFTGLGNTTTTPTKKDQQVINISSANLTTAGKSTTSELGEASNIVCKTGGQEGPGSTFLLADDTPGFWRADMNFGYEPSLLRIYNTHYQERGTKTFRFTAIPLNGIMNFTYTDPDTGDTGHCDSRCPLSSDPSVKHQDFHFINKVGMSAFRIDISEWYGQGGGLDGVELFQNDIFAYAVRSLNEPSCVNTSYPSDSSATGPWNVSPSLQSNSEYLSADLTGTTTSAKDVSVVFKPDIKQQGNYTVTIYTPGCLQDNSCSARGIVNVTGNYATSTASGVPLQTQIYQTNNYDKYDEIYVGPVDINSGNFRPTVTLSPVLNQQNSITFVAQRVQFTLNDNSTANSTLNGLYEFDPKSNSITDTSNSTIDRAGAELSTGATINSIVASGNATYIAGNFSDTSSGFKNIFAIGSGNSTSLPSGGLNAQVSTLLAYEDILYIGGNFTDTLNGTTPGLSNIAAFNTTSQEWLAVGAGVNGSVYTIVALNVNFANNQPETCITFNGDFEQLAAFGTNKAVSVQGFGVWVPSRQNWLQNLNLQSQAISGHLSFSTNVTGSAPLLAGSLSSQDMSAQDVVSLTSNPAVKINPLHVGILPQPAGPLTRKRAVSGQNITGVVTGLFHNTNGLNVTIVGGHFTASAKNGSSIENLAFINSTGTVTGVTNILDSDSVFLSLATYQNVLYAGGTISGQVRGAAVNGLIVYDLAQADYSYPQPPALGGPNVAVNAITIRPTQPQIFVGGDFNTAGSLGCPSLCIFENGAWNTPGTGIGGSVAAFTWQGNNILLVGGNLTVNNDATPLANYDASKNVWTALNGASDGIPGPVTALEPASDDGTDFWVAGTAANGSAFLVKYSNGQFRTVGDLFGSQTTIRGLSSLKIGKNHDNTDLVPSSIVLLITGELNLPTFGNASAALFNGTTISPFILSTAGNAPGSLSQIFSEHKVKFASFAGKMAVGFVVLIALACALGAIFLLVVAGILIERYRRKHEGYQAAPTNYFDKTSNMGRIPPEHLFGRLGQSRQPPLL